MLVGPYLSHPLTRNMKNAHSSNSTPSAPSYSPPFDGIFIQTPLGAGRRPSPPRRAPSHATELAGGRGVYAVGPTTAGLPSLLPKPRRPHSSCNLTKTEARRHLSSEI